MATHDLDPLHTPDRPDEAFEASWRRAFRRRLLMIGVAFVLWTVGIQARLVFLQVVAHPVYLEQANDQQMRVFEPAAKRGDLLDRNGEVLAYSVTRTRSRSIHASCVTPKNRERVVPGVP